MVCGTAEVWSDSSPSRSKGRAPGMRTPAPRWAPTEASKRTVPSPIRAASRSAPMRGPDTSPGCVAGVRHRAHALPPKESEGDRRAVAEARWNVCWCSTAEQSPWWRGALYVSRDVCTVRGKSVAVCVRRPWDPPVDDLGLITARVRTHLVPAVLALAHPPWQHDVWLDPATFENLDHIFHVLYDDFCDADHPERYLGIGLRTEEEVALMRQLGRAIAAVEAEVSGGDRRGVPARRGLAEGRGGRHSPGSWWTRIWRNSSRCMRPARATPLRKGRKWPVSDGPGRAVRQGEPHAVLRTPRDAQLRGLRPARLPVSAPADGWSDWPPKPRSSSTPAAWPTSPAASTSSRPTSGRPSTAGCPPRPPGRGDLSRPPFHSGPPRATPAVRP